MAGNKLIDMAVNTSTFGAELITAENSAAARSLLEVDSGGGGGAVSSVNGQVGAVVLDYADVGAASAAQGALADTALQPGDAVGAITSVNGKTGVVVLSYTDVGAASAAQGAKADTALQPGDIPTAPVLSVNGKTGTVTLTPADVGAATSAQGAKADTAVQPGSLATVATTGSYNSLTGLPTLGTAASQSASSFATAAQGAKADTALQPSILPPTFIMGLLLYRSTTTTIGVTAGSCYVPGSSTVVHLAANTTLTPTLAASTLYHMYGYVSSGALAIEVSTTAPTSYAGTAKIKTGDNTRRYLGSFATDSTAAIVQFTMEASGLVQIRSTIQQYLVVSNGNATAATTFSCAAFAPIGTETVLLSTTNGDASVAAVFGTNDMDGGLTSNNWSGLLNPNSAVVGSYPCNASQACQYMYRSTPTGTVNVRLIGYYLKR